MSEIKFKNKLISFDRIVAYGCSFTAGGELADHLLMPGKTVDEVDKISKTEHGKELVGILTHLLDQTQNDCFQDKYFAGIDLDLSKALFILSYNDVDSIDPILLDRIHRIKFKSLSIEDKLVIGHKYILPEIYKNIGLEDTIEINNDVLNYIIDEYTCESGVRKLKDSLDFKSNIK